MTKTDAAREDYLKTQPPFDGPTLTEMARATGMSLSHICRIFSGERVPSLAKARRMAAYLGISLDELCRYLDSLRPGGRDDYKPPLVVRPLVRTGRPMRKSMPLMPRR